MARTVARPDASRVITSGGTGGGGPSTAGPAPAPAVLAGDALACLYGTRKDQATEHEPDRRARTTHQQRLLLFAAPAKEVALDSHDGGPRPRHGLFLILPQRCNLWQRRGVHAIPLISTQPGVSVNTPGRL